MAALYRLLYESNHPLTLKEIADQMPPAFRTHATVRYKERGKAQGYTGDVADKEAAWLWWLGTLVHLSVGGKRVIADTPDGSSVRGKHRDQLIYTANRNNPPVVRERVEVERPAFWTPAHGQRGARATAGARFLQQVDALLAQRTFKPAEVKAALKLARDALKVTK